MYIYTVHIKTMICFSPPISISISNHVFFPQQESRHPLSGEAAAGGGIVEAETSAAASVAAVGLCPLPLSANGAAPASVPDSLGRMSVSVSVSICGKAAVYLLLCSRSSWTTAAGHVSANSASSGFAHRIRTPSTPTISDMGTGFIFAFRLPAGCRFNFCALCIRFSAAAACSAVGPRSCCSRTAARSATVLAFWFISTLPRSLVPMSWPLCWPSVRVMSSYGYVVSCRRRNSRSLRYATRPCIGLGNSTRASGSQRSLRRLAGTVFLPRKGSCLIASWFWRRG